MLWNFDPVRLHHRRQGQQDRFDDRRAHPRVTVARGEAIDHRRTLVVELEDAFGAAGGPPKVL
jgi:hypothetical protein